MRKNALIFILIVAILTVIGCSKKEDTSKPEPVNQETSKEETSANQNTDINEPTEEKPNEADAEFLRLIINGNITKNFAAFYNHAKVENDGADVTIYLNKTYDDFNKVFDETQKYGYSMDEDAVITKELWEQITFTKPENKSNYEKFLLIVSSYILKENDSINNISIVLEDGTKASTLKVNRDEAREFLNSNGTELMNGDFSLWDSYYFQEFRKQFVDNDEGRKKFLNTFFTEE